MPRRSAEKPARIFALVPENAERARRYTKQRAHAFTSEEIQLDEGIVHEYDGMRDDEGRFVAREFERVARRDGWPLRIFARHIVRAARRGGDKTRFLAITARLTQFVHDVFDRYSKRRAA